MPLPKCVKVSALDMDSRRTLAGDAWREIGVLCQYQGRIERKEGTVETGGDRSWLLAAVPDFGFSGRLWVDPLIPRETAIEATCAFIAATPDERLFQIPGKGFVLCRLVPGNAINIDLIGVLQPRQGVGHRLVYGIANHFDNDFFIAGTYSHNRTAGQFYYFLRMHVTRCEAVFHKP